MTENSSGNAALIILLTLVLLCATSAGSDGYNATDSGNMTDGAAIGTASTPRCEAKKTLAECLQQLPPILDQAEMIGIPSTKKEVDASCSAFKTGMGCIDMYSKTCLQPPERQFLDHHLAGARYTFRFLCDDQGFQAEYLKYKACNRGISKDWDACAGRFVQLVREEMNRKNATEESRLLELCCAKHGFLRCVYAAARYKCRKEEALFIRKIAETLSDMRVFSPHCRSVDMQLCSWSITKWKPPSSLVLTALFFWLISFSFIC